MITAYKVKRTITWSKGGKPIFGTHDGSTPHGGNCDWKIGKHKRGVAVYDCRDAVDANGKKNHWFGPWTAGFHKLGDAKRFCEFLKAGASFEGALRATNPGLAHAYGLQRKNGWNNLSWDRHDPAKQPEWNLLSAFEWLETKLVPGIGPTKEELSRLVFGKYGCSGRTSRLYNCLLGHLRDPRFRDALIQSYAHNLGCIRPSAIAA